MASIVGLLHLELDVAQSRSLKDKRRIIQSFKKRTANGYNVSIAEVDGLDSRRRSVLAVAMVGNDRRYVEGALQKITHSAATHRDMLLISDEVDWL